MSADSFTPEGVTTASGTILQVLGDKADLRLINRAHQAFADRAIPTCRKPDQAVTGTRFRSF